MHKNGTARGKRAKKKNHNFPTFWKKEKGMKDENGSGVSAPAKVLTISSMSFKWETSPWAPIIQLIWGNSSMLCKRLSVAMVRTPWRPPWVNPPPLCVHSPSSSLFYKALPQELLSVTTKRERGRRAAIIRVRDTTAQLGGGLNWWARWSLRQKTWGYEDS